VVEGGLDWVAKGWENGCCCLNIFVFAAVEVAEGREKKDEVVGGGVDAQPIGWVENEDVGGGDEELSQGIEEEGVVAVVAPLNRDEDDACCWWCCGSVN